MKISYDSKADALYIRLRSAKIDESDEISDGIVVDYDVAGKPVGIEFFKAARFLGGGKELQVEMALTEDIKK
ncbi:MAG TPA: DUF2283 domain-containing protein [Candidatus Omnitrophota bacterium]|nr:DUF2283 domain-containing protein [Candidatus Omnitrophota bacterium]